MNIKIPLLALSLASLGLGTALFAQTQAHSSASASASASSSALPLPTLDELPSLASRAIPTDASDPPRGDAWGPGEKVEVTRRSDRARECNAYVLREYLKVSCPMPMGGVRQLGGTTKDVQVWVAPKADANIWADPNGGQVIFPLRRGEGFVFQFFPLESGYDGAGIGNGVIVDASWSESDASPIVVLR